MAGASDAVLRRIGAATKKQLITYKEGVHLTTTSGRSVDDLRHEATANRIKFAKEFLAAGDKLMRMRPPHHRSAISRRFIHKVGSE